MEVEAIGLETSERRARIRVSLHNHAHPVAHIRTASANGHVLMQSALRHAISTMETAQPGIGVVCTSLGEAPGLSAYIVLRACCDGKVANGTDRKRLHDA
jgi:hypothetical protein